MPRSSSLKRSPSGGHVSAKSKTGDAGCSAAASVWQLAISAGQSIAGTPVAKKLGECRAKSRALKQGSLQRAAGNEGKAQALEARARGGKSGSGPVTAKDRLAKAKELRAGRAQQKLAPAPAQVAGKAAVKHDYRTPEGHLSDVVARARQRYGKNYGGTSVSGVGRNAVVNVMKVKEHYTGSKHSVIASQHKLIDQPRASQKRIDEAKRLRDKPGNDDDSTHIGFHGKHEYRTSSSGNIIQGSRHIAPDRRGYSVVDKLPGGLAARATKGESAPATQPAKPSLREQADRHRAGKGDKAARLQSLAARAEKAKAARSRQASKANKEYKATLATRNEPGFAARYGQASNKVIDADYMRDHANFRARKIKANADVASGETKTVAIKGRMQEIKAKLAALPPKPTDPTLKPKTSPYATAKPLPITATPPTERHISSYIGRIASQKGSTRGGLVPIHEIRNTVLTQHGVKAASDASFNPLLKSMRASGKVNLTAISDNRNLTPAQHRGSIPGMGESLAYIEPKNRFAKTLQSMRGKTKIKSVRAYK